MGQIFISIAYLIVIINIYLPSTANVPYVKLQPLLYGPFLLTYSYQIAKELTQSHYSTISITDAKVASAHKWNVIKLNASLVPNWMVACAFCVVFSNLLCLRLDDSIKLTYFVILIPCWLLLLYICSYVILVGLASTNKKVNKAERLVLSLFVPLGFLTSTVLAVCFLDGYITVTLVYLYIP